MKPKVSVIMPLYNKAPYVRKAVESVVHQSFKDWELIVVDDGSTDGSDDVAKQYLDERCRLYKQDNQGVSMARNRGVALSEGELLAFLDADDWWDESFLEEMVHFAEENPDAGLWACNYWYEKRGKTRVAVEQESGYFDYAESYLRNEAMPVWTGAVLMQRDVFDESGGFRVGIRIGEDFLLWSSVAMRYRFAFLNKVLAYYNNDVPASARATRNLYSPEQHMLFHLGHLDDSSATWKALCDKLRVNGLLNYWLSEEYHEKAEHELRKVDWTKQSKRVYRLYHMPCSFVRFREGLLRIGSKCKQWIMKLIYR